MSIFDEVAELSGLGLILPVRIRGLKPSAAVELSVLIGHGLGSDNPKSKTHLLDSWVDLVAKGTALTQKKVSCISYTARGHGESQGWEVSAEANSHQFTWESLSSDMVAIASYYQLPSFVVSGSSMGSATSLYAAIRAPEKVRAVIMIRPPTAWKERLARRKYLLASAKRCEDGGLQGEKHHFVLRGAALADLPDIETDSEVYRRIICSVLILTVEGDATHPVSTATALNQVLPNSELHIAADKASAMRDWPDVISRFLLSLPE